MATYEYLFISRVASHSRYNYGYYCLHLENTVIYVYIPPVANLNNLIIIS